MPWPDFFIVGAPRSGTTAMATYLDDHPAVRCLAWGPHYYERDQSPRVESTVDDPQAYEALFEGAEGAQRVGEKSVWYLRDPWAPKAIHRDVPDADILVLLRNPVEMVPSLHARRVAEGDEPLADLEEALDVQEARRRGERVPEGLEAPATVRYLDVARYADPLRRWLDVFGEDQVRVLLYDDLAEDPAGTYDAALAFLGLEPGYRPGFERVRPRRRVRSGVVHRLLWDPPTVAARAARALLPPGLRERAVRRVRTWNLGGSPDRDLDPAIRARLEDEFRDEIRDLEGLLDRDLSDWLEPDPEVPEPDAVEAGEADEARPTAQVP